jgi:hypothetical protein
MTITWKIAGMVAAPSAWAALTQAGQVLPYVDCRGRTSWSLFGVAAAILVSLVGIAITYTGRDEANRMSPFVGSLGIGIGLALMYAILLQGAAVALLNPCQF